MPASSRHHHSGGDFYRSITDFVSSVCVTFADYARETAMKRKEHDVSRMSTRVRHMTERNRETDTRKHDFILYNILFDRPRIYLIYKSSSTRRCTRYLR